MITLFTIGKVFTQIMGTYGQKGGQKNIGKEKDPVPPALPNLKKRWFKINDLLKAIWFWPL
jgi:hypothetical protein